MTILDKVLDGVESTIAYISRYMVGKDLVSYCELASAVGLTDEDVRRHPNLSAPYILVGEDNTLITVFECQGTYQILSDPDFMEMIENLRISMNGYMRRYGHSLTFSFERDPDRALDELMRLAEPQLIAARRMGLASEDIILDRVRRNAPLCAWEQSLLVVYTHLSVMDPNEQKRELKERAKQAANHKVPRMEFGQSPAAVLMAMKYRHDTMIDRIKKDFERSGTAGRPGIMLSALTAHEAVKRVRIMVNRERTSQKFRPVVIGDRIIPRGPEREDDYSDLALPKLSYQICTDDICLTDQIVVTDSLWHGNLSMDLGPQEPQPFSSLFASVDREIPWRVRIDLRPGGLDAMRGRRMLASFTGMFPSNQGIRQSFLDLEQRVKHDAICQMQFTASTWSNSKVETMRRMAALEKAIQGWGIAGVTTTQGDPVAAWASTIPAFTTKNLANLLVPPLTEALSIMPLQRPATPWAQNGSLIVRTPDGKIYPIQLGSRLQDTWIELISAPPGSGKSVLLNTMNNATIHRAGNVRLPLMTIIDVGPSSSGLISLIRESLPSQRKHEAVYLRLQNSKAYAVNPFDTQLGCRFPTSREKEFLVDLLTLFCTDPADRVPPSPECARVNEMLVEIAYRDRSEGSPIPYETTLEPEIDELLVKSGLKDRYDDNWWSEANWWEVTDMLFEGGYVTEAAIAQRYAVPILPDFAAYLNNESIQSMFGSVPTKTGEPLLKFMTRCFTLATNTYEVFSGRTRFELNSNTRVISLDLNDVIGAKTAEGSLRTAIMYMFARQLAAKNYFLREEVLIPLLPALYVDYHTKRIADVQDEQKTIAYDEVHNTKGQTAFIASMIKDGREGRKWGVRIVGASQYLEDYPEELLNAATAAYVMRGGSQTDEALLQKYFDVSDAAIERLQREAKGPSAEGGNFLAVFKTKVGTVIQMLTNTAGPIEMWAFSTTQEDVALRNRLYKKIGPYSARKILAEHFPLGSAMETIEMMRNNAQEHEALSVVEILAERLYRKFLRGRQAALEVTE
ncbi:hypothetical protein [Stutzerimonas nitrititolerans]|uniref:hypothetical protein n=1 Tax=Stutzerimonas nitrititolerans TaxID=2482751 RepID=UPI0028B0E8B9|nr:hypothetical protein [Stutzerimonas nitrititolerans]